MLPQRQQRSLEEIEKRLLACDGPLAHRFSLFAELVRDDEMPRREELRPTVRDRMERLGRSAARPPQPGSAPWVRRVVLLIPALLMAITCAAVVAGAPSNSHAGCGRTGAPASIGTVAAPGQQTGWPSGCVPRQPPARR